MASLMTFQILNIELSFLMSPLLQLWFHISMLFSSVHGPIIWGKIIFFYST